MPSEFDSNLAFALGNGAAALVAAGATAYMATAHCLTSPVAEWRIAGSPLVSMMSADRRSGAAVAIIRPSEVDLRSASFRRFKLMRERLAMEDLYCNPGPMQFASLLAARAPAGRLSADDAGRAADLEEVEAICREVAAACWPGCHADVLRRPPMRVSDASEEEVAVEEENVEAEMAEMVPVPVAVSVTKQGIAVGDIVALVEDYVTGTGTDAWQCPELVRGMAAHTRTDAHAHMPCNGTCQHTASAHGRVSSPRSTASTATVQ